MHGYRGICCSVAVLVALIPVGACGQVRAADARSTATIGVDAELARFIAQVPAVDNHAHTVLPPPNDASDREFDALPVDSMEPQTDPVGLRADNPQLAAAWKALWGFGGRPPLDAAGLQQLGAARAKVKAREGARYDEWVLDRAGVGTQLSNRVKMGPGLAAPRYRWVPYDDALMFPLNNSMLRARTPDRAQFFPLEAKVMQAYLQAVGLTAVPATLDEYLQKVVLPTLAAQKRGGAVAIKFEAAYLRGLDFADALHDDAARVYAAGRQSGSAANPAEYKLLQDFLFRAMAVEAGRLGMAVHLHTMAGAGGYFSIAGANAMLLEPLFNDPRLRGTKFVMLHGGWPFVREAGSLLQKPNVYLDLSQQALLIPPRTLAVWLREWLEMYPDKVLYATDAYPYSESLGWEESLWMANANARGALGIALTGMMRDGEIDRARAQVLAEMVLRGNAVKLYGLP